MKIFNWFFWNWLHWSDYPSWQVSMSQKNTMRAGTNCYPLGTSSREDKDQMNMENTLPLMPNVAKKSGENLCCCSAQYLLCACGNFPKLWHWIPPLPSAVEFLLAKHFPVPAPLQCTDSWGKGSPATFWLEAQLQTNSNHLNCTAPGAALWSAVTQICLYQDYTCSQGIDIYPWPIAAVIESPSTLMLAQLLGPMTEGMGRQGGSGHSPPICSQDSK